MSYRNRKISSVEVGHTILNVLAVSLGHFVALINILVIRQDFRNFQYTIPTVPGVMVTRIIEYLPADESCKSSEVETSNGSSNSQAESNELKTLTKTRIALPKSRYDAIMKALQQNNDYIIALGGNFNLSHDGVDHHYACIQNDEGQHVTKIIGIHDEEDPIPGMVKKIGASFVVFSGALKSSTGLNAKTSIVEDGILIQIPAHHVATLKTALKDKKDYVINCNKGSNGSTSDSSPSSEESEVISLEWVPQDVFNIGVRSPIDCKSLEGIPSIRIHNGTDYSHGKFLIRWTEVFVETKDDPKM